APPRPDVHRLQRRAETAPAQAAVPGALPAIVATPPAPCRSQCLTPGASPVSPAQIVLKRARRRPAGYIQMRPNFDSGDPMSRRVRVSPSRAQAATGAGAPSEAIDTYFDKVVKFIPADIVAAWVAVTGLVASAPDIPRETILWIAFAIGLILTAW